jgi:Predicted RNA-binding protein (consists of S1 domain and a Zn-ribbon domain)
MSENAIFPGDKIASIEEYEAGHNAFDDGDMVRAATIGEKDIDMESRTVNVKHPKLLSIPKVGDIIIGTVAAVMGSMIAVSIDYINGKPPHLKLNVFVEHEI